MIDGRIHRGILYDVPHHGSIIHAISFVVDTNYISSCFSFSFLYFPSSSNTFDGSSIVCNTLLMKWHVSHQGRFNAAAAHTVIAVLGCQRPPKTSRAFPSFQTYYILPPPCRPSSPFSQRAVFLHPTTYFSTITSVFLLCVLNDTHHPVTGKL